METGKYRHYKGGEYEVYEFTTNQDNGIEMASYRDTVTGIKWTRPVSDFTDRIQGVLRFEKIPLSGRAKEVEEFIRDIATNYDHSEDSHRYGTNCFVCDAEKLYASRLEP